MHNWVNEKYKKIGLTRQHRIQNYLDFLEEKIEINNKNDKHTIRDLKHLMKERYKAVNGLQYLIIISYCGIYFSFLSFFMSELIIISDISNFIGNIIGFFGSTIFVVMLFITTRLINLHYQDLNLLASHVISIYQKYDSNIQHSLFENLNNYNRYIQFFKKRGL